MIRDPGVYMIPPAEYHADPVEGGSLTSSGARRLLPPSCPALYKHWRDSNQPEHSEAFDFGHVAHRLVLGAGEEFVIVHADDWRTKAAKQARAEAYAADLAPILEADFERAAAMAEALHAHPVARALFNPDHGSPEQTLIWRDKTTGVMCRALVDWLPHFTVYDRAGRPSGTPGLPGRLIIPDYKTCGSAAPDDIERAVNSYGYHQQAAWYLDGVKALMPAYQHPAAVDPAFVFVFQMKTPPYLVTVAELDAMSLRIGQELNRTARETYRQCTETGTWPGFSDGVELISLPTWVEARHAEEYQW